MFGFPEPDEVMVEEGDDGDDGVMMVMMMMIEEFHRDHRRSSVRSLTTL